MEREAVAAAAAARPAGGLHAEGAGPALLAGPWLCMAAGIVAARLAPDWILPLGLGFWALVVAAVARELRRPRELAFFVPVGLLYFATFLGLRERVRAPNFVLGADTWWHLQGGQLLYVQFRHLGYGIVSFASRPVRAIGESLAGSPAWGDHYLFAQSALAGALAAACLFAVVSRRLARREALLFAHLFALSFAVWALSATVDTFMLSLLLFLLFLASLLRERDSLAHATAAGLLTATALLASLENAYFAVVYAAVFLVDGAVLRRWRFAQLAVYALVAALAFGAVERLAFAVHGPKIYRTALDVRHAEPARSPGESLERYAEGWLDLGALREPARLLRTLSDVALPYVMAQPDRRISAYAAPVGGGLGGRGGVAYLALALPLAGVCLASLARRRWSAELHVLVAALAGALLVRTVFMTVWAHGDGALFSPPSIATLWIAIAAGASLALERRPAARRLLDLWLLGLVLLLLANNGSYLRAL